MKRWTQLTVCLVALLSAGGAFAQDPEAQTDENTSVTASAAAAPVALVYVQTTPGVMVYTTAANGTLTVVKGSPFKVIGQMEDISGKFLISVGDTLLHVYSIASNGAVGKQISQINTASYLGSECGGTSGQGSVVDHTGKYLYVQLNTLNNCAAWQTYRIESDGYLQFLGYAESYQLLDTTFEGAQVVASTVPTISSNDKFQYGVFDVAADLGSDYCAGSLQCQSLSAYKTSGGILEQNFTFSEKDPVPESGFRFIPWSWNSPRADGNGHLAVLVTEADDLGSYETSGLQVASYSINPSTGALTSTNTCQDMPNVQIGWEAYSTVPGPADRAPDASGCEVYLNGEYAPYSYAMAMSPAGNILAIAGTQDNAGIQLFHFNGAAPATAFGNEFYYWPINQIMWDSKDHLYALDYEFHQLTVFTVTTTTVTQVAGTPYNLPAFPYGTKGMIVVSK
jgi:hypothetical protein